jgi:hypothetical protein
MFVSHWSLAIALVKPVLRRWRHHRWRAAQTAQQWNTTHCCVVCLEDVDSRALDVCTVAQCGHVLHAVCLQTWRITKEVCPTCRGPIACQHSRHSASVEFVVGVSVAKEIVTTTVQLQSVVNHRLVQAIRTGVRPAIMGVDEVTQMEVQHLVESPCYQNAFDMLNFPLSKVKLALLKAHLHTLKQFKATFDNQVIASMMQAREFRGGGLIM